MRDVSNIVHHGDSGSSPAPWICFTIAVHSGIRNGHNRNFRSGSSRFYCKFHRYANLDWIVGKFCSLLTLHWCNVVRLPMIHTNRTSMACQWLNCSRFHCQLNFAS